MKRISLDDKDFKLYIGNDIVMKSIETLTSEINSHYEGHSPVFLCVLNGAFMFASELIKRFHHPCEVSFIKVASYHGTKSSGELKQLIGLNESLHNRNVIIVEDIVDTGSTIEDVCYTISKQKPKSVEVATLLFKPNAYKKQIPIKYSALEVGNEFLVGFGLDYKGLGRNLDEIYIIEENK